MVAGNVEADEGGEGGVFLVPIEGGRILRVAVVPVPCFAVRLRAGGAAAACGCRSSVRCHFPGIIKATVFFSSSQMINFTRDF